MADGVIAVPNPAVAGDPIAITFVYPKEDIKGWSAEVTEDPSVGGSLNPTQGKTLSAGERLSITYVSDAPTTATVTISAASASGTLVMRSVIIKVMKAKSPGVIERIGKFFSKKG